MSSSHPLFASDLEVAEAKDLGVFNYFLTIEGRFRLKRLFEALDHVQDSLSVLKLDPWDGHLLAAMAQAFLRADRKVWGWFKGRKPTALKLEADVDRLHVLLGKVAAEKYLAKRDKPKARERRPLAVYDGIQDELLEILKTMQEQGRLTEQAASFAKELAASNENFGDGLASARRLMEEVLGEYESLVSATTDAGVPTTVQDKAIAKAAFMQLRAEELEEIGEQEGLKDLPTREALADALAQRFREAHDDVARLVLRQEDGDPEYGLITRLVPLDRVPDLNQVARDLKPLIGRFFEPRVAQWFVFRELEVSDNELTLKGRVHSYSVRPAEVAETAKLNARPHKDDVMVRLRRGLVWAETDARTVSDLNAVRAVLKRAQVAVPLESVPSPAPIEEEPYSGWDPRTLWMLELMWRELSAAPFSIENVVMVNFERPSRGEVLPTNRPSVQAVRLRGSQLQDHPEVCALITRQRHMLDVQLLLRFVANQQSGTSLLLGARIVWAGSHLAVMTGGDSGGSLRLEVHRRLVRLVRDAVGRDVTLSRLRLLLARIERNAGRTESEELDHILAGQDGEGESAAG